MIPGDGGWERRLPTTGVLDLPVRSGYADKRP